MNKRMIAALICAAFTVPALAADPIDKYFSGKNPTLTRQERDGLKIRSEWEKMRAAPRAGKNGTVVYWYGSSSTVLCAPLQVCDVALQPGELVNSINLGDTVRWTIDPAITGSGANEVQHLIVKPHDVGLETSLVVTTNRRAYHITLRSHRTKFMPQVAYVYPEEMDAKWAELKTRETQERAVKMIPATGEYLGDLSFDYDVKGSVSWKPVRVFNDGRKTIIEMPQAMARTEAPALLVVRRDGGLFSDAETVIVNYRLQGNRYIVDTVFDKAILIAGVGSNQDRVTITKGGE